MDQGVIDVIMSYGALGAVTVYFMVKDMTVNRELTGVIKDFTITLKTFIEVFTVKSNVVEK